MAAGEKTYGSYVVEREIGTGGMGSVHLGQHRLLERPAVLKKMRRELSSNDELVERFRREARTAAAIHHPNVVAVYDCFNFRGDLIIAQEYVDGVDLETALSHTRRLPPRIAGLIALELLRGLEEVHGRGIVHRDLKPANILLGSAGETKIADFGIAFEGRGDALTRPGVMMGSPPYMTPEQMLGERVDYRGDLFAWGVVFYEMLAAVPPFQTPTEDDADSLLKRIQRGRYRGVRKLAPATPRWMARLIHRCLRAQPRKRIQGATLLRTVLERRLGDPPPASCRAELARWLWDRSVIEADPDSTVRAPAAVPPPRLRLPWVSATAAGAVAAAAFLALGLDVVAVLPAIEAEAAAEKPAPAPDRDPEEAAPETQPR